MQQNSRWEIVESAYLKWANGRDRWLGTSLPLYKPTVKNAIALALLESQGRYLSYDDINQVMRKKGVVKESQGGIPVTTLRVAVSELSKTLEEKGHFYQLRTERSGRQVQFAIVDRKRSTEKSSGLFRNTNEPLIEPRDITRRLVRDGGGLHFASLYASSRAAAQWLCFSATQGSSKKQYEAEAFDAYDLSTALKFDGGRKTLGFVSLGTGEGLGEIELLDRLFREEGKPRPAQIQYAAIATSAFLLTAHSEVVRERFGNEIADGRLVYAPLVGDVYQLSRSLLELRAQCGMDFLDQMPILCTYFGNCLGNDENHEWEFFRSVKDAFPKERVSIMLGISLLRRKGERLNGTPLEENYTLDSFLLETPRYFMYDLKLLRSEGEMRKNSLREFLPEAVTKDRIPSNIYDTADGIKGSVYRFQYQLKHDLVTWDGTQRLPKGSKILLYSIVKYDLNSVKSFLTAKGFKVLAPPDTYYVQKITDGEQEFRYAVFTATLERKNEDRHYH